MLVGCFSRYGGCRGNDCMLVGCYSRYGCCRGNDCMLVGCFSRYGGCRGNDCMLVGCYSRYGCIIQSLSFDICSLSYNILILLTKIYIFFT